MESAEVEVNCREMECKEKALRKKGLVIVKDFAELKEGGRNQPESEEVQWILTV